MTSSEADVLRCGYDVGFFDKTNVVAWADRQIESIASPCRTLLDLSMSRRTHPLDVSNLLRSLASVDPATTIETRLGFIGLLVADCRMTTQLAIRHLRTLVREPGTTPEQESEIYMLDGEYHLADSGTYGTIAEVEEMLLQFLTPYAEQLAHQYPHLIPANRT